MTFHLQTLLDLRRNAEEGAKDALEAAVDSRRQQENEQARLLARWREACDKAAEENRRLASGPSPTTGEQATAREHYQARLRDEASRLKSVAEEHRATVLTAALATEGAAQTAYEEALKAREAVDKLKERADAEADRKAERRADESAADLAQAAHFKRRE